MRDALLGLPVPEIDVAVERDSEGLARALAADGFGTAVFVSRDRPGPRVFRVAGRRPLDIAELEGDTIEKDLGRRDFTVNALALSLETGEITDPFGGLEDLARRRLRPVHPRNLLADPLRALRAARFRATHALLPDRETLAAARRAAPGLWRTAPERITAELWKLLGAESAQPAWVWASRAGLLPAALGLRLRPPRARRAALSLAALDRGAARALPPERRRRLRLARLATRLGLTPRRTRSWLRDRRAGRREADEVPRLQELAAAAGAVETRRDAWRWVLEAGPLAADAVSLFLLSRPSGARIAARLRRLASRPPPRVDVTGDDVVRWLGIPPGPEVGRRLSDLRLAAAMGAVRNRRQARNWLSGQAGSPPDRL